MTESVKELNDHIIFYRDLPPERARQLAKLVASDAEAARVFQIWRELRDDLGRRLDEAVGDRDLFALYVLREHGGAELLTASERSRLDEAAPRLREAIARHPGWSGAADEISAAADEFAATWDGWFGERKSSTQDRSASRREGLRRGGDRALHPPRSRPRRWTARVAIGATVVAFAALLVFVLQRDHGMITIEIAEGETRIVELGGGSTVHLIGESRLSYTPPEDVAPIGRQVEMRGRGFFQIVPAEQGLVVKTEQAQLTVLGTSFGVRTSEQSTEVVLAGGRLSLAPLRDPARSVVLEPGQMSRVDAQGAPSAPESVRVHEELRWTGLLVFSAAPLQSILDALQRSYDVDLDASPDLSGERITGTFEEGQDLEEILRTLAAAVAADVQELPEGGYRID